MVTKSCSLPWKSRANLSVGLRGESRGKRLRQRHPLTLRCRSGSITRRYVTAAPVCRLRRVLYGHLFNTQVALDVLSAGVLAAVAAEGHAAGQVASLLQALGAASQVGLHRGLPITVELLLLLRCSSGVRVGRTGGSGGAFRGRRPG